MAAQRELYDAIVIGAGIQGCFTAYHLAKHSKKVLLLEQFFLPHTRGSSHGQSRIIRRAYPEDFYTQMMAECYSMWAQLEHEAGTQLYSDSGILNIGGLRIFAYIPGTDNDTCVRSQGVVIPGEGNGNPLQYSCPENPIDRGAWQATVHGVARVGHDLVHCLRQTGLLLLGMKENPELKIIQATLSRQGVEHQCLSSEELKQRFPNIRLTRGEVGLLEASGGVLYADKALRALQDAIRQLGGIVHDGEKVVEIKPGLPVTVKTTSRSYQAKSLIITAGPWTNRLLSPLGAELPLQTLRINVCYWQEKVPGSYSVSQAFPCFMDLGFSLAPHHIYGLPSREYPGLMKVCYHHGNNADPEERDCPAAFSDIQDVHILSGFVRDHLPDLQPEPAVMEHCMYTNTPDGHFVLDRHPKYDNIVIGAGFSGHGFKLSPVVGKILYELSMKLTPSYDLTPFRISRFPSLGKAHL